ncbi:MAG: DUF692 domain-containing protein [Chromatiales bacterium]|jgi:uncharacterized protein (UPF0276 family)|nr:DUF692 domain-containing protein [Chromatiales bacterium]
MNSHVTAALSAASVGIGLRSPHHAGFLATRPAVGFVEVHSENFFAAGGPKPAFLAEVRRDYPVSFHGVGLSLGGTDPLDRHHLAQLKALVDRFEPVLVSEHACWSSAGGVHLNDLLPLPYTEAALGHLAGRVRQVQDTLGRRILVENVSACMAFASADLTEWEFLAALADRADCDLLLDVNNVYVSSVNLGFDPWQYIEALPVARVREIHLAGYTTLPAAEGGTVLVDTHSAPVADVVLDLYARTRARFGAVPLLLEWDADLPPLADLVAEAERAVAWPAVTAAGQRCAG